MTTYQTVKIGKVTTSKTELIDITKAWIALSFAFALIYGGISVMRGSLSSLFSFSFVILFLISFFTAGLGFLLHELSHKFVAQRYGCVAEFRAFNQMLWLAVGLAFLVGFIFAAPGAVMISGMITRRENGIVSVAGAVTNYILGFLFLGMQFAFPSFSSIFLIGFNINMWLGLFNMIPFGPLDGLKVFHWNKIVWGIMVVIGVAFVFFLDKILALFA